MSADYELRVINKPLYYIEMVALLNRLAIDSSFMDIPLTNKQKEFLAVVNGFGLKGFELFELFLINENLYSIDIIEKELNALDATDFLSYIFDEKLTREEVIRFYEQPALIYKGSILTGYSNDSLKYVFERTMEFISIMLDIFKVLDIIVNEQLAVPHIYDEGIAKVSLELKSKVPLDVAQGIMGKKFRNVYDYSSYYFVPSYFYMNRPMRTYNHSSQIVVYPVQEISSYNKDALANALRIIGDSTRLAIIEKLSKTPMFGKELAAQLGIVTSTVSHHLEQLRTIGLIHEERVKSVKYFSINRNEYKRLCEAMERFVSEN